MSIRVMSLVWDDSSLTGSALLGMLALADWSNDEGTSLHPSIRAFSRKCRLSDVQGRRVLHELIAKGYVEVIGNHAGGAPGTARQYRIVLPKLRSGASKAENTQTAESQPSVGVIHTPIASDSPTSLIHDSPTSLTGDTRPPETALMGDRDGSHRRSETPLAGESLTIIEPSINHQLQHAQSGEISSPALAPTAKTESALSPAEIAGLLIGWERCRKRKASSIAPSKQPVIDLATLRITTDELRRAYDDAVADREANTSPQPINAGFIRVFIEKNRQPAPARPSNGHRDDNWHRSEEGIKRKATELGLGVGPVGHSWDQLKARCFEEINRRKQQEAVR